MEENGGKDGGVCGIMKNGSKGSLCTGVDVFVERG